MQQNGKEIFKYNERVVFILKIVLGKSLFVIEKIPFEKNWLGKGFQYLLQSLHPHHWFGIKSSKRVIDRNEDNFKETQKTWLIFFIKAHIFINKSSKLQVHLFRIFFGFEGINLGDYSWVVFNQLNTKNVEFLSKNIHILQKQFWNVNLKYAWILTKKWASLAVKSE